MKPHWIYETDEAGRAASSAPFRTDAVTKARMKLGLPVMATIPPAPGKWSADEAALQPAQIAAMAGGAACRNDAIVDPVAILHRAIHERNAALRALVWRLVASWESVAWGCIVAFAVVALVYAL